MNFHNHFLPGDMTEDDYRRSRRDKAAKIVGILHAHRRTDRSMRVLDVGCYDGVTSYYLASHYGMVVAVDPDADAIHYASRNLAAATLSHVQASGTRLPFSDASFDIIVCNHVLYYVSDQQAFMDELLRVLKDRGVCYVSVINGSLAGLIGAAPARLRRALSGLLLRASEHVGSPLHYRDCQRLFKRFEVSDLTEAMVLGVTNGDTVRSGWQWLATSLLRGLPALIRRPVVRYSPTYIFLLSKPVAARFADTSRGAQ